MNQVTGDLLSVEFGILGHQVNLRKTFGAGLAKQIKLKWPHVFEMYAEHDGILGECFPTQVKPGLIVANLYGQTNFGVLARQTHYGALAKSLVVLNRMSRDLAFPVYLPYKMSSDLAGADWTVVIEMIEYLVPLATICKLPAYNKEKEIQI